MIATLTWANPLTVAILTFLLNIEYCSCLSCWHCIADNCAEDPADNYKASKKQCSDGQTCQKVYFEMYSKLEHKRYESTVRGCSSNCQQRDDFSNCTTKLRESRGCIKKTCCGDTDLCNRANLYNVNTEFSVLSFLCLILILTLNMV